LAYGQDMTALVEFFGDDITCLHCKQVTRGFVYEHSGMIICSECDEALFDASDMDGGTVVILQLEDERVH